MGASRVQSNTRRFGFLRNKYTPIINKGASIKYKIPWSKS
jgi:hypothetical protein